MLLHDDHDASSPSRNSSPDVVLMVANPDVERVERGTSPHRPDAGRIDRGTSPQQPGSTGVLLTPHINNFSDDDAEDYAKFKERERTRKPSPERASRNTPRHESSDDRNQSSLGPLPVGVSPPSEGTRPSGVAGPSGFRARTAAQLPSHGEAEPIPVLSETAPAPVPTSGSIPSSMGGPTPRTNPHAGELERHADALLQRNTISAVIQMATAMALQRLANFSAGQPGNEHSDVPRRLASASLQIRALALQTDPDTASWYAHNDGRPRALLIHPDEFSQYVNRELLPALLFGGELGNVQPSRTDPFRVVTWNVPRPGEHPTPAPNPRRVPRTVVERPPPRQREVPTAHSHTATPPSHRIRGLPLSQGNTDEEEPPVYRRNEGRRSRGNQATLGRGTTAGRSVRHWPRSPPPSARLRTNEREDNRSSRRTRRIDSEARRNSSWTRSELDAWDALDDPGNYDEADPYYRPDEGGGDYQGPFDY
ncbi:hypothetical protein HETIRDRAFT_119486 [Heterobasidion irregulare TC 32-1]|uniref:Uncharacterized protein n=1 Tax=Heterobasidion irregulare (strain TC 32-1) TaxID=747525 RepID=W4KA46_HETIT|nr:uncharacterized protein HETIRDRAFT_119486 [Heterobasidion irregulare TC 32-1]ETW82707.1 hypothetical protein HETIRDRAFT_119486 [Heterobasidion irregulare TC 32-1]